MRKYWKTMCGVSNSNSNRNSHCRRHHHHHHRHHNNGNIMINIFLLLFLLRILFDAQQIDSICFTLILLPETVTTHEKSGIKGQIYGVLIWLIHISKRKKREWNQSINLQSNCFPCLRYNFFFVSLFQFVDLELNLIILVVETSTLNHVWTQQHSSTQHMIN